MVKDHGPQIKHDKQYEALRDKGMSKEKAARIANTGTSQAGKRGGQAKAYDDWSKQELQAKAKQIGLGGISKMTKAQLIDALRNH